jgi:lipid-binding SYLF domain-containing protein
MNRAKGPVSAVLAAAVWVMGIYGSATAVAASAQEIDIKVDATLEQFKAEVAGGAEFLERAKGVLVFPNVVKAGLIVGGEHGSGALRVGGKSVAYYSTTAGSIGLQAGAQSKSEVIVFLTEEALDAFQAASGWEAGVDGNIAVVEWGAGDSATTVSAKAPIVGFVFGNKGLMLDVSFEGSKYKKLDL